MGDPDQPRPQRPAVGLAPRAVEVAVGLQEGLLGQVLGVVVVARPGSRRRSRRRAGGPGRSPRRRGPAPPSPPGPGRAGSTFSSGRSPAKPSPAPCGAPRIMPPASRARPGAGRRPIPRRRSRPRSAPPGPQRLGRDRRRRRPSAASSGTVSSPSEAWPISAGISSAGVPAPSSSPARRLRPVGAIIVAVRSPTPARPAKVSSSAPRASAYSMHSRQISADRDPGGVEAVRLGRGGGERGGVLGRPGHLDPGDVAGALADQAGAVEDLAELGAQVGVGGAEHQRRRAGDRLAGVGGAAEAGDRPRPHPFADVLGRAAGPAGRPAPWSAAGSRCGRRPGRRSRRPPAAATSRGSRGRSGRGRRARSPRPWRTSIDSGSGTPGQVALVLAASSISRDLLGGAGAELDLEAAAGEQHRHRGAPAAGADHRGAAHRRQAAEVFPLQLRRWARSAPSPSRPAPARAPRRAGRSSPCRAGP